MSIVLSEILAEKQTVALGGHICNGAISLFAGRISRTAD